MEKDVRVLRLGAGGGKTRVIYLNPKLAHNPEYMRENGLTLAPAEHPAPQETPPEPPEPKSKSVSVKTAVNVINDMSGVMDVESYTEGDERRGVLGAKAEKLKELSNSTEDAD